MTTNGISSPQTGEIDYFELFLEEAAFTSNQSIFQSTGSTPSTLDSPDSFQPYTINSNEQLQPIPSTSSYSNNSFHSSGKLLSSSGAILPSSTLNQQQGGSNSNMSSNSEEQFKIPTQNNQLDWRNGTGIGTSGEGPFTVDAGGTSAPSFAPNASTNQDWIPSPIAQSYSGTSSPYLYQPVSYSVFGQQSQQQQQSTSNSSSGASSPHLYSQYQSPATSLSTSPIDPALLALHMSLEAQAQEAGINSMNPPVVPTSNGRGGSTTGRGRGRGRGKAVATRGATHPVPQTTTQISSALPSAGGVQPFYHNNYDFSGPPITTYQRPLPPMPKRPGNLPTPQISTTPSSTTQPSTQSLQSQQQQLLQHQHLLQQSQQHYVTNPYANHQTTPTPPLSRPVSPRVAGVDYDFSALERDLDHFSTVGGGFASAAAAAMASVGSKKTPMGSVQAASKGYSTNHRTGDANVIGGVGGSGTNPTANLFHHTPTSMQTLADILPEPFYASLPARTPTGLTPGNSQSPKEVDLFASLDSNHLLGLSPVGSSSNDSPSSSTIIDEDSAEALSKKDPIAAQVWRMFNKAKHTLPNGARMENLTWRMMSMSLRKRREETAAAELLAETEAAAMLKLKKEEEEENLDNLGVGRKGFGDKLTVSGMPKMRSVVEESEKEDDRGRRGRSSKSSSSESPEGQGFEEDFMDWRAKSQSRSRSRAPGESVMDWRAQSRSRSRAPAFRTPMPPPEVFPAVAHRFRSDSTSTINDSAVHTLAASLGLSPTADLFGNTAGGFDGSPLASSIQQPANGISATLNSAHNSTEQKSVLPTPQITSDPNLVAIADTLNQLISLQSLASTPQQIAPSSISNNNHWPSVMSAPKPMAFASTSVNSRAGEGIYGSQQNGEYAYSANGNQALLTAQQQLHQLLSQGPSLNASTSNTSTIVPQAVASSPYATAAALAQSTRPFNFNPSTASGLSLARPQNVVPESPHTATPGHTQPPTPSHVYPQSAPAYNHLINPFNQSYYGTEALQHPLYDYFSPASAASSYSSSFQMEAPSINPSHLLNGGAGGAGAQSPQLYETDNHWGVSPRSGTESSRNGSPSPPNKLNGNNGVAGIHFISQPSSRAGSVAPMRTVSAPDLDTFGKSMMSMSLPSHSNIPLAHQNRPNLSMTSAGKPPKVSTAGVSGGKDLPLVDGETKCLNCSTTNTPLWRRDGEGRPLCNACGLFRNLHGVDRPANLNTGVIKKRNRARGIKEVVPKKVGAVGRTAARRNSTGHSPPPAPIRPQARAGDPYPSSAARAGQF